MTNPTPSVGIDVDATGVPTFGTQDSAEVQAAAQWRAAEGRLYPLITVDPALYEAAVTLVCEAADVLRWRCCTVRELVDVDAHAVLSKCPSASVMIALGFDPATA